MNIVVQENKFLTPILTPIKKGESEGEGGRGCLFGTELYQLLKDLVMFLDVTKLLQLYKNQ